MFYMFTFSSVVVQVIIVPLLVLKALTYKSRTSLRVVVTDESYAACKLLDEHFYL